MKNLIIILTLFLFTPLLFGQSKENCYVVVESSKEFNSTFLSNISASIISQFLREVKPIPPEVISREACFYQVSVSKQQNTTFVTFKGKNLNSYGDSKLSGTDEFNSFLKSLFRALTNKRHSICEGYGELLKQCKNIEVNTDQTEIYSVSQDTNKQKWILFYKEINWNWERFKDGNEEKDGKYIG